MDDVRVGGNWNHQDIDLKTCCIVTMVALMAPGITDSLMVNRTSQVGIFNVALEPGCSNNDSF